MTTTSIELSPDALKLLKRAAKLKSVSLFFEEGQQVARSLITDGLLIATGHGEYKITPQGLRHVYEIEPAPKVSASSLADTAPKPKKPRMTPAAKPAPKPRTATAAPAPQSLNKVLQTKRFSRLSDRQQAMLRFVDRYVREIGYPPTIREIGDNIGISSTSVVNYNIERLEALGWLDRTDGVSRGIRLVQELPGNRAKPPIQIDHGVLRIFVNLSAEPETVIEMAQAGIERLLETIAEAQKAKANHATE